MVKSVMPYVKKIFSLALLFNAVLTFDYAIQILAGFYASYPYWKPYPPYIFDGAMFWIIIPIALINFFPAVSTGQTKCSRLFFHHYVYGFVVAAIAAISLLVFLLLSSTYSLFDLFTRDIADVNINLGRFFVLGGLTMILDDLPDVAGVMKKSLSYLKLKAYRGRRALHVVQLVFGFVSLYFCLAIVVHIVIDPQGFTLANVILIGTLLVTTLTAFATVKRRTWLNLKPDDPAAATESRC
jgi:hypothetical protein